MPSRASLFTVVSAVTASGTNQFHGKRFMSFCVTTS